MSRCNGRAGLIGAVLLGLAACQSQPERTSTGGAGTGSSTASSPAADAIKVGLITKTETNPFFVKMREGAAKAASARGASLLTATGKFDGDNESQLTAIENMIAAGVKGILITPNDSKAIVPALERARRKNVLVIALDTPTEPESAADALFATDNRQAGKLIGAYAKAKMAGQPAKVAMLDLSPGVSVGKLRHAGFLEGFGIAEGDPAIVCQQDTRGDQALAQTAMENCLVKAPELNVVYTINEPAALGAVNALRAKRREKDVLVVSIDGGCTGVRAVKDGQIAATSQQYPLKMAELGVEAVVEFAQGRGKPSGYTDTGVTLISETPLPGVEVKDAAYGVDNCWG